MIDMRRQEQSIESVESLVVCTDCPRFDMTCSEVDLLANFGHAATSFDTPDAPTEALLADSLFSKSFLFGWGQIITLLQYYFLDHITCAGERRKAQLGQDS